MGDHRPKITVDFEMHGHKAHYDFGWRNWGWDSSADEIADWLRDQAEKARAIWQADINESFREQREREQEEQERAELARLKSKYEPNP